MSTRRTAYLIDGSAYIHRAFHAIAGLANSRGMPTNAVFGFTRMLIKLMEDRRPEYAAMVFDARGPTFRHRLYAAYKATRPPMPEELAVQIPFIKEVTAAYRLPVVELTGYEADDVIGTLARRMAAEGFAVVMVTGDKDFVQLVGEQTSIWDPMKDAVTDLDAVRTRMGIEPAQMVDVMGLSGDTADNIPGVPGIGPKTALDLIRSHGSLETLYANLASVARPKLREKLAAYREQAFLSRRLAAIDTRTPVSVDLEALRLAAPDAKALSTLFKELEFRQLQHSVPQAADLSGKDYRAVLDPAARAALVDRRRAAELAAIDTETTSTDPMRAELVGISVAVKPDQAFYIPCGHFYLGAPQQLERDGVLRPATGSSWTGWSSTPCWAPICWIPPSAPTTWTRSPLISSTTRRFRSKRWWVVKRTAPPSPRSPSKRRSRMPAKTPTLPGWPAACSAGGWTSSG